MENKIYCIGNSEIAGNVTMGDYDEASLESELNALNFSISSGYYSLGAPLQILTVNNAEHFLTEAKSTMSLKSLSWKNETSRLKRNNEGQRSNSLKFS